MAFAAVFASLLLFKGTSLGYLAGQPSLVVSLLLYAFAVLVAGEAQVTEESAVTFSWWQPMNRRRWLAACCLAAAASKPNLAAPFFLYLLLRRDAALLVASIATTLGLHVVVGFFWIGPAGYAALLWRGPQYLQAYSSNVVEGMGATGRIDLEPLLAIMGMSSGLRHTLLGAWGVAALAWILRKVRRLSDRELLVALNAIFLALLYHRDYDLVVFVLLALPLLRASAWRFSVAFVASSLPFVLPLQFLREVGLGEIPTLAVLWNLVGCSMVVGVVALTAWLLHGSSRARQDA